MVDITYKYSEHMTKAIRDYHHHSLRFWVSNGIGLAIVLLEIVLYFTKSNLNMLWIALLVLVLLALLYFITCYVQPNKFASDARYAKPFTLSADECSLRLKSDDLDTTVPWNDIRKVCETDRYYFLFLDQTQFWIAPKEAFSGREQEDLFRELAGRYLTINRGLIR